MAGRSLSVVLLLMSLPLAGCLGSGGEAQADEQGPEAVLPPNYTEAPPATHEEDPNFGSIVGFVVDDEYLPLRNALVGFVDPYIAAVTGDDGAFEIGQVPPGPWDLYVIHLGHKADGVRVQVSAGQATKVVFELPPLPIEEPWIEIFPAEGRFDRIVRAGNFGGNNCGTCQAGVRTTDRPSAVTAVHLASVWQKTQSANTGVQLALRGMSNSDPEIVSAGSPTSPVAAWVDAQVFAQTAADAGNVCVEGDDTDEWGCTLRWTATPYNEGLLSGTGAVGVGYDQPFRVMVSVFYRMDPPQSYSPFPDA